MITYFYYTFAFIETLILMKKTFALFTLLCLSQVATAQVAKKFAVIVGCADYQIDKNDLRYSDDDAYRFYAYLKSSEGGALPDENMAILVDEAATKTNIINTMQSVFSKANANDMLIFYFSGHGAAGAFVPTDAGSSYQSLLSHQEVKAIFKKYPARYKICFGDACHSGSIYEGQPTPTSATNSQQETNILVIMSSLPTELSEENAKIRQGAFSYYLLKGLKGSADRNQDNSITVEELFPYIKANVLNLTKQKQTPIIEGNAQKDMVLGIIK